MKIHSRHSKRIEKAIDEIVSSTDDDATARQAILAFLGTEVDVNTFSDRLARYELAASKERLRAKGTGCGD